MTLAGMRPWYSPASFAPWPRHGRPATVRAVQCWLRPRVRAASAATPVCHEQPYLGRRSWACDTEDRVAGSRARVVARLPSMSAAAPHQRLPHASGTAHSMVVTEPIPRACDGGGLRGPVRREVTGGVPWPGPRRNFTDPTHPSPKRFQARSSPSTSSPSSSRTSTAGRSWGAKSR